MYSGTTRCQWCPKLYTSPGAYSTHLQKVHTEINLKSTGKRKRRFSNTSNLSLSTSVSELDSDLDEHGSTGRRHSDQSNPITFPPYLDLKTLLTIVSQDYGSSDIEYESEGFDRKARDFTSDSELDSESQLSDQVNLKLPAGIAIKKYSFQRWNFERPQEHV